MIAALFPVKMTIPLYELQWGIYLVTVAICRVESEKIKYVLGPGRSSTCPLSTHSAINSLDCARTAGRLGSELFSYDAEAAMCHICLDVETPTTPNVSLLDKGRFYQVYTGIKKVYTYTPLPFKPNFAVVTSLRPLIWIRNGFRSDSDWDSEKTVWQTKTTHIEMSSKIIFDCLTDHN